MQHELSINRNAFQSRYELEFSVASLKKIINGMDAIV